MTPKQPYTPALFRGSVGLLDWTMTRVSLATGLEFAALAQFAAGARQLDTASLQQLALVLGRAGVRTLRAKLAGEGVQFWGRDLSPVETGLTLHYAKKTFSPAQLRSAAMMLNWTDTDTAGGIVPPQAISSYLAGRSALTSDQMEDLALHLRCAGVVPIGRTPDRQGVRFQDPHRAASVAERVATESAIGPPPFAPWVP